MLIALIVAMSENRGIGLNNQIPWRLPADQNLFREKTMGHHIVMGRKTYESIGRPLPGRKSIVVTRNIEYEAPGCDVVHSVEEAYELARSRGETEVFNIGGASLYEHSLQLADRIYLTVVHKAVAADTFMPSFEAVDWALLESWKHEADAQNEFSFTFKLLERILVEADQEDLVSLSRFTESITFFYTRNLEVTSYFYESLLGLRLVLEQADCRVYKVSKESFLGFCERENAQQQSQGVIFTFVTEDVDGWVERLKGEGVAFEKEPALNEKYGIYNCFFRDPNGYLLEIQRFLDSDWRNDK